MKEVAYILGKGGHARVIASFLPYEVVFIDRDDESAFLHSPPRGAAVYVGIGDNSIRERVFNSLTAAGIIPNIFVCPGALVAPGAEIGAGSIILPGAVVMTGVKLGENCIVDLVSSIDHDSVVGAHTFIGPGVNIPGQVKIGSRCFFGVKSATFPRVTIGNSAVIRAGSLVIKDVEPGTTVGGNPAVRLK